MPLSVRFRYPIAWLAFSCLTGLTGCNQSAQPIEFTPGTKYQAGKIVLGSPSLTAGIPGTGPLTERDVEAWLASPLVHIPFEFTLPAHLLEDAARVYVPEDNRLTRAKIELGRQLFFDKRLSGYGTFACATCHQPEQHYSSYMVMPEVGRNASTDFNRILGREHFWDGRAASLEQQPLAPIENPFEMNSSPEKSVANIQAVAGYRIQFERIFGEVSFDAICKALACFQRVNVTAPCDWDNDKLSPAAKRGEQLFFSDRLRCGECHHGANLTDESYHDLGTNLLRDYGDEGRYDATKNDGDKARFKTPSLRNVAATPPYMHNGALGTLEEVVDFFDAGGHPRASDSTLEPLELTDPEKQDLIEFLKSLTSEMLPVETGRLPE